MSTEIKKFDQLFKETGQCECCWEDDDVPVEWVVELEPCGCCDEEKQYCKECYFKWLYNAYCDALEDNKIDDNIIKKLHQDIDKLEKELKAYNATFQELKDGKL